MGDDWLESLNGDGHLLGTEYGMAQLKLVALLLREGASVVFNISASR